MQKTSQEFRQQNPLLSARFEELAAAYDRAAEAETLRIQEKSLGVKKLQAQHASLREQMTAAGLTPNAIYFGTRGGAASLCAGLPTPH